METVTKVPTLKVKELTKDNLATLEDLKAHVKRSDRLAKVPFENIRVREGFNLRKDFGDIEALAFSIGSTELEIPLTVDIMNDGTALLRSGERRFRAIQLLRELEPGYKQKFEYIPCMIASRSASELDRLVGELNTNSGKSLEPLEEAEGFLRLKNEFSMNLPEMSRQTGRSVPHIEQRLLLASEVPEIKKAVKDGKITPTAVVQLNRKEKDPEKRKALVKKAVASGKKVSVKAASKVKKTHKLSIYDMASEGLEIVKELESMTFGKKLSAHLEGIKKKFNAIKRASNP